MTSASNGSPAQKTLKPFRGAWILVLLAALVQLYRLATVVSDNGETPFLSANDRSRWCTIAALIEDRSFIIDRLLDKRDRTGRKRTWYSIDMVRKPEVDGSEHYYSSKPPLLSVLYATVCSPLSVALNRRLTDDPLLVGRALLLFVQWIPWVVFCVVFSRWIARNTESVAGRWLLLASVLFGTFLSTFSNTLNNHLPAAFCMIASIWLMERAIRSHPEAHICIAIGCFVGLTAAFELPALAWAAATLVVMLFIFGLREMLWVGLGMLPVGLAFAATNYIAYGDLQPPYAHREVLGRQVAVIAAETTESIGDPVRNETVQAIASSIQKAGIAVQEPFVVKPARRNATWEFSAAIEYKASSAPDSKPSSTAAMKKIPIRFAVIKAGDQWSIHRWNDWYDYPKSYWLSGNKQGVDLGEPSRVKYAFHVLIGHHGIFSLTPIWFLTIIGAVILLKPIPSHLVAWKRSWTEAERRWVITAAIVVTSVVCLAFYLARPLIDRNYGGVCSGFRWQFWLIPAWLWLAAPAYDFLGRKRWGVAIIFILLAVSVFSAHYAWHNPWQHPWPYAWLTSTASSFLA
jgi:hypothetical protein